MSWFSVDKEGLRQINERLVERRGFGVIVAELYQNVMDTDATECNITTEKMLGRVARALITVEDNGPGFNRLTDAWTMFAPSMKKDDPTKAGRFNIGEKVVLSFCYSAKIETTSGTVVFDDNCRGEFPRRKREQGTKVTLELRCTNPQFDEILSYMPKLIVRDGLRLRVNGAEIESREPIEVWEETLPTEIGEDLRPSRRKTEVRVYEPLAGETPMLYELGIPVVETGDRWHVSIEQKVPLNTERDNVTPAFLREVRVAVVNRMHDKLTEDDTESTWVNEATSDKRCADEAAETFRVKKYGEKSVAFDPNNAEANAKAVADGYTLIPSRGLTGGQRTNLRSAGTLKSSSQEFPTAGLGVYSDSPDALPVKVLEDSELTRDMRIAGEYARRLGNKLLGGSITVRFVRIPRGASYNGKPWSAAFGHRQLDFNVSRLGKEYFSDALLSISSGGEFDSLLIHEFGHHYESNHLSERYYQALCDLGARLKALALEEPNFFEEVFDGVVEN